MLRSSEFYREKLMYNFVRIQAITDLTPKKEDAILIGENTFGVFDGAGSLVKFVDPIRGTGGKIASSIARDIFTSGDNPVFYSLEYLARKANLEIRKQMAEAGIDVGKKVNLWSTTAAVVRMGADSFEWLRISDSVILIIRSDGEFKLLVDYHDHDKELLAVCRELAQKGEKDPHSVIVANGQAQALREKVNITYGALNGEEEAMQWIKSGIMGLEGIKHILIFTDGLLIPKEDPKAPNDWALTVKLFLTLGLDGLVNFIRDLQQKDPFCRKYIRYHPYDDIAAIAISRKD